MRTEATYSSRRRPQAERAVALPIYVVVHGSFDGYDLSDAFRSLGAKIVEKSETHYVLYVELGVPESEYDGSIESSIPAQKRFAERVVHVAHEYVSRVTVQFSSAKPGVSTRANRAKAPVTARTRAREARDKARATLEWLSTRDQVRQTKARAKAETAVAAKLDREVAREAARKAAIEAKLAKLREEIERIKRGE